MLRKIILSVFFMSPFFSAAAIPFEGGITFSAGERIPDQFDRGLDKYRSSVSLFTLNAVSVTQNPLIYSYEGFIRFNDVLAEHHAVGISAGNKKVPGYTTSELRTDGLYQRLDWIFYTPYFMINYYYMPDRHPIKFLRRWNFELGGGFGPVMRPEMKVSGYYTDFKNTEKWYAFQDARFGMIYRFETALTRRFFQYFRFRAGLRYDHLYMGGFEGNVNSSRGSFFYTYNGGIMPLSYTSYNLMYILQSSPYLTDAVPVITSRILYTSRSAEVFFSFSSVTN